MLWHNTKPHCELKQGHFFYLTHFLVTSCHYSVNYSWGSMHVRSVYYVNIRFVLIYEVQQFNSWNSCSMSLGCWVRQAHVLKHVWTCSNLRLLKQKTKWIIRSWAAEEVVCVRGIWLAEKWVTRIWSSRLTSSFVWRFVKVLVKR